MQNTKDLRFENRTKKVALFLKKLHDATKKPTSNLNIFKEIGKETGIGSIASTRSLLVNELKILSITKNKNNEKVVAWIGPEPNIKIATNVTNSLAELFKSYGKVKVEVTQAEKEPEIKEIPRIETIVEKGNRPDKEFRVHMFMQFLYEKIRDLMLSDTNLDLNERLRHYSLEPEIMDVLVANKFVDRERCKNEIVLIWATTEPTEEMVKKVTDELVSYIKIDNIRSSFSVPIRDKSFNTDEVKVINVLKNSGKKFAEIANIVERSESEVKKMFYDYIIKMNS